MTVGKRVIERRLLIAAIIGFMLGTLWLVAIRYITWKSTTVHYHANFGLFINDQKDEFDSFTFYEEVQNCGSDEVNNPKTRAHMHDRNNHIVHVHDNGVTWGAFFANLDYVLGDNVLKTDKGTFIDGVGNQLTFILNGELVETIANRAIASEDKLLINYGHDDLPVLTSRYDSVSSDAHEYNQKNDPSTCAGSKPVSFGGRLRRAIGIGN